MDKITLTEMPNTVVRCATENEANELMLIYEDAGWKWLDHSKPTKINGYSFYKSDTCYRVNDEFCLGAYSFYKEANVQIIGLQEFKELQGIGAIMNEYQVPEPVYKVGDILESDNDTRKVLGICGEAYLISSHRNHSSYFGGYTLDDLNTLGYKLSTEKPKTKLTKQEIADRFGINEDDLEIVEE